MRTSSTIIWLFATVGCAAPGPSAPLAEKVVACAADGTCPPGTHCVAAICEAGAPADAAADGADAAAGDTGTADAGGEPDAPAGADGKNLCLPDLSGGPSPRGESSGGFAGGVLMAISGDAGVAVQCNPSPKPVADSWTFTPCSGWAAIAATSAPTPRARAASTNDDGGSVYLFGGRFRTGTSGPYTLYADTWRWNADSGWQQVDDGSAGPKARSSAVLGVDPSSGVLWLHGGNASTSGATFTPLGDTWFLDPAAGAWQSFKTTGKAPGARIMHSGAVTRDGNYLVIHGGGDANAFVGPFFGDTWRLDLHTGAWSQIGATGDAPAARILGAMVASGGPRTLLFGGHDDGAVGNRNDIWELDAEIGTWTLLRAGDTGVGDDPNLTWKKPNGVCDFPGDFMKLDLESPERRESVLFSWDTSGKRAWLFGGKSDCGTLRDVWSFDPATAKWTNHDDTPKGWSCLRYVSPCSHLCGG